MTNVSERRPGLAGNVKPGCGMIIAGPNSDIVPIEHVIDVSFAEKGTGL
jgi:hypothetical protein